MAMNGTPRLGTPVKPASPSVSAEPNRNVPPRPATPPSIPPPPPVIPTSLLQPNEQRLLFASLFGLVEVSPPGNHQHVERQRAADADSDQVCKLWDIAAPYFTTPDPTWSNSLRLSSPLSAAVWTAAELAVILSVAVLRIPQLSPSLSILNVLRIVAALATWNAACLVLSSPGAVFQALRIDLLGPPSLGGASLWSIIRAIGGATEQPHLGGKHQIRLLPYRYVSLMAPRSYQCTDRTARQHSTPFRSHTASHPTRINPSTFLLSSTTRIPIRYPTSFDLSRRVRRIREQSLLRLCVGLRNTPSDSSSQKARN